MGVDQILQKRPMRLVYALLVTLLSLFVANPYEFGVHDHWYMLPWIKNLQNPELFARDLVIGQRQYHYSVFYYLMAYSPFALSTTFFTFYALGLYCVFYLSMAIHRLFSSQWLFLTPLFLLLPWFTPGGTFTLASHLLMRTAGLPFLLLALYFHLKPKPTWAWTFAGLAFLFHPTTALYLAAFFGIELLLSNRRENAKNWLSVIPFLLLCVPVFYQKITASGTGFSSFWADSYWLETIRIRSAHHAFPDAWHPSHIKSAVALVLIAVLLALALPIKRVKTFLGSALIGLVIIYLAGFIFTYWLPAYSAIQIQPFRVSRLLMLLVLMFIPIGLSSVKPDGLKILVILAVLGLLCFGAYQQSKLHFFFYFSFGSLIILLAFWKKARHWLPLLVLVPLYILVLNKPFEKLQLDEDLPPSPEREMYQWIKGHTTINSLWVIPSDLMYFRNYANRSVFIGWYDGTFGYFDHNYNRLWRERYQQVYGEFSAEATEPLNRMGLSPENEGPDYLVKTEKLEKGPAPVWQNSHYFIYRL